MKNSSSQKGQTIIELILVLLVLAVVTTFALASFGNSKKNLKRQNFARELKSSYERARSDSMKRRASTESSMARVVIHNAASFSLSTDLNQNQIVENSETKHVDFAGTGVKFVGTNLVYPITIRFDRHGFINATNGAGAQMSPVLTICDDCDGQSADPKNSNVIAVSPTGAVSILKGGEIPPAIQTPTLSNVSTGSQINSLAVVNPTPTP